MSRLATLPNALRVEIIERAAEHIVTTPIEGGRARVDMTDASAIYVIDSSVFVHLRSMPTVRWRFVMADETAACEGADRLARAGMIA